MTAGVRQQPRGAGQPRSRPGAHPGLVAWLTGLVLLSGVGYRLWLLAYAAPPTNSDEATMGLAALHIARGEGFPVWFYGQQYMGALEAYLAAPVFALAGGPSLLGLRLPTLALYVLFLLLAWRLTLRLTGDRWFGLLVVTLLALGSDRIIKNQLIAGGGYPEMNAAGVALAVLAVDLASGRPGWRPTRWAVWGFLAGLMLWVDPLVLPYVVATGAVLVAFCRRELRGAAGALLGAAAVLGAAPLLLHSLLNGRNPLQAVLAAGGANATAGWADRLHGGLLLGPALGMGFCAPGQCATWQLWWALALPLLLAATAATAWRTLRRPSPGPAAPGDSAVSVSAASSAAFGGSAGAADPASPAGAGPTDRVAAAMRLALVLAAVGTLGAYTLSSSAGLTPVESSRYLSCLLISLPALLWPVWTLARHGLRPSTSERRGTGWTLARPVALVVLAATIGTAAHATWRAAQTVPATRAAEARHTELVDTLRKLGVRHVRAGYWTCNRLTFASAEQVVCAVVDDTLRPGFDRYPAYRREVDRATAPAWVAAAGSPLANVLDERLRAAPGSLDLVTIDGWRIYLPRT
ncbi:hypothetical protein [Micromonospora parathelypteridis]|uniref:Uncharacterized protein n=1 Tax=Micromonospora parathelypteridis TaxID=1839617 RepID=A0A840VJ90_9ACTN|nr:hypothetical protein [Micromonospora parathelypteridis]MBB5476725.1 hypothetical protein [Micromonospora parathelypteridis]GGO16696.1 hypothetical protein GCM10011576_29810 [Micromonospora parathelypteridis]